MQITRVWAMPNSNTFSVKPIGEFVKKYLALSKISADPYARNCSWATYTNDLNPDTSAQTHMDAIEFVKTLPMVDLLIVDPPYSPRQVKECYNAIGIKVKQSDTMTPLTRKNFREAAVPKLAPNGRVLTFGWNTVGMGKKHGFEIEEILLVCHGSDHNDTICMSEVRV